MSKKTTIPALLGLVTIVTAALAREKWPPEPPEHKAAVAEAQKRADEQWQKIQPELAAWAEKGKPFIPSAAKPSDLPQAKIPAFPGAEGGGMYSFGGRGGRVFVVTSLDDSGPGTLREACESAGPRVVVFNVAGVIHLKSVLDIRAPYITIAGQSAPGDGVCVAGASTWLNTHDVVVRYMRFRRGLTSVYDRDDALGGNPVGNVIVDHCSCSWGLDENVSMYRHIYHTPDGKDEKLPTCNITIQWTISSEALNPTNHAFGGTWGGTNDVFHHNLFACNTGRNPSIGMGGDFNFVNNVLFNWRHRTVDGGDDTTRGNIINNYFKPGPVTPDTPIRYRIVKGDTNRGKNVEKHFGKFYAVGNIVDGNDDVTKDNWNGGVQAADVAGSGSEDAEPTTAPAAAPVRMPAIALLPPNLAREMRSNEQFPMAPVTIQSAKDAYAAVLAGAGATLPKRDPVDVRVIEEVRTGQVTYKEGNGILTDVSQVGGYPEYKGTPYKDSDHDGIPDDWETRYGLNANDPTDAIKDLNADGYTNIEKYINGIDPTKKVDWTDLKNNIDPLMNNSAAQPVVKNLIILPAEPTTSESSGDQKEAEYTKAIDKRSQDIVDLLQIEDPAKAKRVHEIIMNQYRTLRAWHDENDARLKSAKNDPPTTMAIAKSRTEMHDAYLASLATELTPEQIEKVKDKMTYGKVQFTMKGYEQVAPDMTDEQKAKVLDFLKQAREEAMDGGSSQEKDAIFNKYKGKINNYLAKEGVTQKKPGKAPATKAAE